MSKKHPHPFSVGPVRIKGEVTSTFLKDTQGQFLNNNKDKPTTDSEIQPVPKAQQKNIALAEEILKEWDLDVENIEVIEDSQVRMVWKVMTPEGTVCLKRISHPRTTALFAIHAQNFLNQKGANVPSILITKDQQLFAQQGPFLFVATNWIEGWPVDLAVPEDRRRVMHRLADFHLASEGYHPPDGISAISTLGNLPKRYAHRCKQLQWGKIIAKNQPQEPFSQLYLDIADEFIEFGKKVFKQLNASCYRDWVRKNQRSPLLTLHSIGSDNIIWADDDKIWIIHLDDTKYGLPICDLREMIIPIMSEAGTWHSDQFEQMLSSYVLTNPLTPEQKEVMLIDMMFPYEFYEVARAKFLQENNVPAIRLEEAAAFERLKKEMLEGKLRG